MVRLLSLSPASAALRPHWVFVGRYSRRGALTNRRVPRFDGERAQQTGPDWRPYGWAGDVAGRAKLMEQVPILARNQIPQAEGVCQLTCRGREGTAAMLLAIGLDGVPSRDDNVVHPLREKGG